MVGLIDVATVVREIRSFQDCSLDGQDQPRLLQYAVRLEVKPLVVSAYSAGRQTLLT